MGYRYDRTWDEIQEMLDRVKQKEHFNNMKIGPKMERVYHMRNYKALEGVIKSLKWVLGDESIDTPLE